MKLYEFEGKEIAKKYGIAMPEAVLLRSLEDLHNPIDLEKRVVKAQLLTVKSRAKAGAVKICESLDDVRKNIQVLLANPIGGEKPQCVMLEEKVDVLNEYYVGITYDTSARMPVIIFTKSGGIEVESSEALKMHVNPMTGLYDWMIRDMLHKAGVKSGNIVKLSDVVKRAYDCFCQEDCKLLEINPIAETNNGFVAVDVAIELDGDANYRHKDRNFGERAYRQLTDREAAVKKANETDYKGTAKYIELDGDIGFLAAGGGGSLTCMDALMQYGGRPSNYTEYSGNPSSEKVYELTKQIISKPGLRGLWVVGAIANFTRVDTTMEGIARALAEARPKFPIIVRRSGPFEKEGLDILRNAAKEHRLNIQIFGKDVPMTESARMMAEAARNFSG